MRRAYLRRGLLFAFVLVFGGCATKQDTRILESAMRRMSVEQEAALRRMMEDLQAHQMRADATLRDLSTQLRLHDVNTEERLERIEAITGVATLEVAAVQREIRVGIERMRPLPAEPDSMGSPIPSTPGGELLEIRTECPALSDALPIIEATRELIRRQLPEAARDGANEYIRCFHREPGIAAARLLLAESYVLDRDWDRAMEAFGVVVESHRGTPEEPVALYRMGIVSADLGNYAAAETYFHRILRDHPRSSEARLATEALGQL